MVHVPRNAEWYVAEIIEEITVDGDTRNVVHKNLVLIRADSPDEAFTKSLEIGRKHESSYTNPDGKFVSTNFRGLGYLDVVHDSLEHGAELLYDRKTSVPEEEICKWVLSKEKLPLFLDGGVAANYPDYASKDILDEAKTIVESDSSERS